MSKVLKEIENSKRIQVLNLSNIPEKKLKEICENMLKNKYFVHNNFPIVEMKEDDIWSNPIIEDRSFSFWLHSLIPCEHLVNGYEFFQNKKYLDKAIAILKNWKKFNYPESNSELAWHDHSTALRLIVICKVIESCKTHYPEHELLKDIEELVQMHCDLLSNSNFYMPKHNHGLDQDISLYIASIIFEKMQDSSKWRKLSFKRFWIQINELFSADGSYLEHSPHYSYLLCDRLLKFLDFLKKNNDKSYKKLEKIIIKHLDFLIHITQPDGLIPPIGDSVSKPLEFEAWINPPENSIHQLRYLQSKGTKGKSPENCDKVFTNGGYAIFRNKWQYDHQTVQLIFYSSFHSRVHKHHDDLSITLFGHKQPLLIDSGKYNYNYTDPGRQYVISPRAHNTVIVDNKTTDICRLNIEKSGLISYSINDNFCVANGAHCLYSGIIHHRMILYIKPCDIIILDNLEGYANHHFEQVFNFSPNINCISTGKSIVGKLNNKNIISLSPLLNKNHTKVILVKGQENPLRGWCSIEYGKLTPSWLGCFTQDGKKARFATHINLNPNQNPIQEFQWIGSEINLRINEKIIQIFKDNSRSIIYFDNRQYTMTHIDNSKLENVIHYNKFNIISLDFDKPSPQPLGTDIKCKCTYSGEALEFAWYILKDNKKILTTKYSKDNTFFWNPKEAGSYTIKVFVKEKNGFKKTMSSEIYSIKN